MDSTVGNNILNRQSNNGLEDRLVLNDRDRWTVELQQIDGTYFKWHLPADTRLWEVERQVRGEIGAINGANPSFHLKIKDHGIELTLLPEHVVPIDPQFQYHRIEDIIDQSHTHISYWGEGRDSPRPRKVMTDCTLFTLVSSPELNNNDPESGIPIVWGKDSVMTPIEAQREIIGAQIKAAEQFLRALWYAIAGDFAALVAWDVITGAQGGNDVTNVLSVSLLVMVSALLISVCACRVTVNGLAEELNVPEGSNVRRSASYCEPVTVFMRLNREVQESTSCIAHTDYRATRGA